MNINFEKELNPEQLAGVMAVEGPVLVLAGAGSGKTRMLTYKIAYLIKNTGIDPRSILAVTFTNKAANEMKERVQSLLGSDVSPSWLGTFHSICGKLLRKNGDAIGIPNDYIIYDEDDSRRLLRDIIYEFNLDTKTVDPRKISNAISKFKRKLISPEEFSGHASNPAERTISRIYLRYDELLRKAKAVDFDDMISLVVKMLMSNETLRNRYSEMMQYILVDEFQDTNESQSALLKQLTALHKNITVVGDDDQSIYSWRGAQIKNILDFPKNFPDCKIIRLEQNYRSTGHILSAASGVISHNRMRHKKKLFTKLQAGEKVILARLPDDYSEARFAVEQIGKLIEDDTLPGEIAILYRINALSRIFEQELRARNIPYVVVGGVGFYERAEVKDILAYLRLIINPDDDISFKRIVNRPRRGIGAGTVSALAELASSSKLSLLGIVENNASLPVSARTVNSLREFSKMLANYRAQVNESKPSLIIQDLIQQTGYLKMLAEEDSVQAETRMENLGQLVSAAVEFEREHSCESLQDFLQSITLMTDVDRWAHSSELVNLMTIHAAKGLEFEAVFIVGAELGVFPLARALSEDSEMEEERRLFYVALTRAKRKVTVCFTGQRGRYGTVEEMAASPFVKELPLSEIQPLDFAPSSSVIERKKESFLPSVSQKLGQEYHQGMKVQHPFFGIGIILMVRGEGENTVLTVDFQKVGRKKLVAGFAKLQKL